ncbi:AlwI restriction endonuclease [Limihaloglobus sulfuriphilus]|uniref:AlwI restriction endonuclease n=1 Tax=Limihaloglobus sulfuriphilus TaxID=1851148 RepID=A0A1Q2MAQ7_9BACT|nr:AlwI family type II restriction endonuclease [Limihaloglobus sulfuriphilus]AQQ69754.1 AlwI restriction endonuclease [Limihaloglobus sulfuriphilus]
MRKPWSITTTLRNPNRLKDFLMVLHELNGLEWSKENQIKYQILLIKNRIYGYGSPQFYSDLPSELVDLINDLSKDISFEKAKDIFHLKQYKDPDMRGRQSINPLKKFGFVSIINGILNITELGKLFLYEESDPSEVFLKSFLKWQIPSPGSRDYSFNQGYDVKPFLATLHLINRVNEKETDKGGKPKGLSRKEFSLFVPTLVNHADIEEYAEKISSLRSLMNRLSKDEQKENFENYKRKFIGEFLNTSDESNISRVVNNLDDYSDNAIRYFRLTGYIHIRGNGYYVDLEPRRSVEIESLLGADNAAAFRFEDTEEYIGFMSDISLPKLPWETREKHLKIVSVLSDEIVKLENDLNQPNIAIKQLSKMSDANLKEYIAYLRKYRRELQGQKIYQESQKVEVIKSYINSFSNIYEMDNRALLLEKFSALSLNALNDAIKILPNYPVGDDNEPTNTAPGNMPDIECFYESFNSICEVTMLRNRDQWFNEGQPVMRHLRDFEDKYPDKKAYCLFIAPVIHRDTRNTFWTAAKYEYEGRKQKIIPLSFADFIEILNVLLGLKLKNSSMAHTSLVELFEDILDFVKTGNDSGAWINNIPTKIQNWKTRLLAG